MYSVRAEFADAATRERYLDWLRGGHCLAVVREGGALSGEVTVLEDGTVESRYLFGSRAVVRRLRGGPGVALRAEGASLFPPGCGVRYARSPGDPGGPRPRLSRARLPRSGSGRGQAGWRPGGVAMAGRIRDEDIALVRERTSIADVDLRVRDAQVGRRRQRQGAVPVPRREDPVVQRAPRAKGVYFCYGCGAGGDAITFVMTLEHLSFVEAVERLAGQGRHRSCSYVEAGPAPARPQQGQRQRLVAAQRGRGRVLRRAARHAPGRGRPASSWPSAASTRRPPRRTAAASPPTAGTR